MERTLADYLAHAPVFVRTPDGEIVYWTQGAEELYGYGAHEARGRISHELLQTVLPEPLEAIEAKVKRDGEWSGRLRHTSRDGREIWTESVWRLRDGHPGDEGVVVEQNTDITERVQLERQRELLTRELDHRVKNTLAVVQALARMTFSGGDRPSVELFEERLIALSEAHNMLHRHQWEHGLMRELIEEVLGALNVRHRVMVTGPELMLAPSAAVSYALAFHELTTNALKHGALSNGGGRVDLTWKLDGGEEQQIHLTWRERGGPPVKPPQHEGFGARLIRRAVAAELGASVDMRFEPDGLVCEFNGPVQRSLSLAAEA